MKRVLTTLAMSAVLGALILFGASLVRADTFPVGIKTQTGAVPDLAPLWRLFYANLADATALVNPTSLTNFDVYATIPASGVLNPNVKFRLEAGGNFTCVAGEQVQLAIFLDGTDSTIGITPNLYAETENATRAWSMVCEFEPRTVGSSGNCYAMTWTSVMAVGTNGSTPTYNVTSTQAASLPSVNWTAAQDVRVQAKFGGSHSSNNFQLERYRLYVIEK